MNDLALRAGHWSLGLTFPCAGVRRGLPGCGSDCVVGLAEPLALLFVGDLALELPLLQRRLLAAADTATSIVEALRSAETGEPETELEEAHRDAASRDLTATGRESSTAEFLLC